MKKNFKDWMESSVMKSCRHSQTTAQAGTYTISNIRTVMASPIVLVGDNSRPGKIGGGGVSLNL